MKVMGHWVRGSRVSLFFAEQAAAGVLFLALAAGAGLAGGRGLAVCVALAAALQWALYLTDLYDPSKLVARRWDTGIGVGLVLCAFVWALAGPKAAPAGLFLAATALAAAMVLLLRGVSLHRTARVIVVGTGALAQEVAKVAADVHNECTIVGYFPDPHDRGPAPLPLLLGRRGELVDVVRRMNVHLVVCASDNGPPEEAMARVRAAGIEVTSPAGFAARYVRRVPPELLGPGELAWGEGFRTRSGFDYAQRALDIVGALVLLVLSLPLLLASMVAIRLETRGPIFYAQERIGLRGSVYRVTKLRTMHVDAERAGAVWAQANDPRVTRVGKLLRKTRIDELPQLFTVLKGDMSLVGPRPERPVFVEQLEQQIPLFGLRQAVKPGLTGWAQIMYPYGATIDDARVKLEYDLYYIRQRSLFLDLCVLFHTVRTVLTARGAR